MKKCMKTICKNKPLFGGVFLAGLILAFTGSVVYSRMGEMNTDEELVPVESTYGRMGYGRGNSTQEYGSKRDNKEGRGRNQSEVTQGVNKDNCLMDGCLLVDDAEYPVGELDAKTIGYLEAALEDERKALATYEAVMNEFGSVRPFINIARAEEQHIAMVKALFDKYGVEIPENNVVVTEVPASVAASCQLGVEAEIANDQLYQDMIGDIKEQDIKEIFEALAAASLDMHLPAFENCAE